VHPPEQYLTKGKQVYLEGRLKTLGELRQRLLFKHGFHAVLRPIGLHRPCDRGNFRVRWKHGNSTCFHREFSMPSMEQTRVRLIAGASKEQLVEEGFAASSIAKAQKQLQKSNGASNGHIPFANLTAGTLSAPAQKTEELAQEVRQAKLQSELRTLQGGPAAGSDVQQLRSEVVELRQELRDQQHREELGRLEAKIAAVEGRVVGTVNNQPSAIEAMIQPFLAKVIERGLDPVDTGLQIDLGTGQGVGIELLTKLDDLVGRRQERTIRSQFFEKAYEYIPDIVEAGKRMGSNIEAHAKERGVEVGPQKVQVHNCPNCGVSLGADPADELIRCPSCGVTFEAATLRIVEEGPAFGGEESGPEPLGGRSPTFAKGV